MNKKIKMAAVGIVSGIIAGLLGSGGGIAVVEGLERSGTEERRAHATSLAVIFPISAVSAVMYGIGGHVPLFDTLWLCGGAALGGIAGAFLLGRVGARLLNNIFTLLMLVSGVWMLL